MSDRRRIVGKLIKLSATHAELVSEQPLSEFDNLKIQIRLFGKEIEGDLYAKVIKTINIDSSIVHLSFTSMSDSIRNEFKVVLDNLTA